MPAFRSTTFRIDDAYRRCIARLWPPGALTSRAGRQREATEPALRRAPSRNLSRRVASRRPWPTLPERRDFDGVIVATAAGIGSGTSTTPVGRALALLDIEAGFEVQIPGTVNRRRRTLASADRAAAQRRNIEAEFVTAAA
jgi:hypothetical protein